MALLYTTCAVKFAFMKRKFADSNIENATGWRPLEAIKGKLLGDKFINSTDSGYERVSIMCTGGNFVTVAACYQRCWHCLLNTHYETCQTKLPADFWVRCCKVFLNWSATCTSLPQAAHFTRRNLLQVGALHLTCSSVFDRGRQVAVANSCFYGGASTLWIPSLVLVSCHLYDAWNFEVALWTTASDAPLCIAGI